MVTYRRRAYARRGVFMSRAFVTNNRRGGYRVRKENMGTGTYARGLIPKYGSFKLRGVLDLSSSGAGIINNAYRITQPDSIDGAGTALTDWTSLSNLYDEFRVSGIKIQFVPKLPNDTSSAVSYQPIYCFMDTDSAALSPTVAACVGYDNCKVYNLYRPFKRYMKVPKLINTAASTVGYPGWMDTASPAATGGFYLHAESLTNSTDYGQIILTYYIKTHNRK